MDSKIFFLACALAFSSLIYSQQINILESNSKSIKLEFDFSNSYKLVDTLDEGRRFQSISSKNFSFRNPGEPWLPTVLISLGIPFISNPSFRILSEEKITIPNKFIIPFPANDPLIQKTDYQEMDFKIYGINKFFPENKIELGKDYIIRYAKVQPLSISPYQFNPVSRELIFTKKIVLQIDYNEKNLYDFTPIQDGLTLDFLKSSVVNYDQAIKWTGKIVEALPNNPLDNYWYDPAKDFFKIYLKTKDVYRLSFEYLLSKGVPLSSGIPSYSFNIYNNGVTIPIDIEDGGDSTFDVGDYIEFVGYPPTPTPFTTLNIYNLSNVYWLSYEENENPHRYSSKNGYPTVYSRTLTSTTEVVHFEKDTLYERLGQAPNANRDYWFWGKANAQNRQALFGFEDHFDGFQDRSLENNWFTLKVNMHGMTNSNSCSTDHKANIQLSNQYIGSLIWDGQEEATFVKRFYVSDDSIHIFPTGNILNVSVKGDVCPDSTNVKSDEIRINWYEIEYERYNRVHDNHFVFKNPANLLGINRYWLWQWQSDSMKIFIPQKSKMILNPQILNDNEQTFLFVDTVSTQTEYFCVSKDYFLLPDSIVKNVSSDLRNTANGADYIIITHPDFMEAANRLLEFRQNNFTDSSITNPRLMIVDVRDIYKEFSYGLLDPYAIKYFIQYAFENWSTPAPSYIALMGDMSYDYRHVINTSRNNYIPSLPFFATSYGQAASDNNFVAISGTDMNPDLAIGRISCETLDEADILVDKIINYPGDDSKDWKQNVLLLSSGISLEDENALGFNDANVLLENSYLKRIGINATKIFRYPNKPEYVPFQGDGPEMRQGFNKGAVIANYYGHGGGYQWDLVFLNDDIYLLENGNRLPFISSVSCYTAHFDNQDVFGEQFNKVPGKGSIGFWGSSGLTYWSIGKDINQRFFTEVFTVGDHVVGKAILHVKGQVPGTGAYGSQVALLTLLADPMLTLAVPTEPDFVVKGSDITISPNNPVVDDTVTVKIYIQNKGVIFPNGSVLVQLFASSTDTSYIVSSTKLPSFGELDSILFRWEPSLSGLFELKVEVNGDLHVIEEDHSDNIASIFFAVFDLGEPNIIYPLDGFSTSKNTIDFLISDIGYYLQLPLTYFIQIDTSFDFTDPIYTSNALIPNQATLRFTSTPLTPNSYFWQARIFNGDKYSSWSQPKSFSIGSLDKVGYYAQDRILNRFGLYNINYSNLDKSLLLNTSVLPPRPDNKRFIEDIIPITTTLDSVDLTTITTDGTYIYFANMSYYAYDPINNPNGYSQIYKVGTGNNGTIKGMYYDAIPQFYGKIFNSIVAYADGFIYAYTGEAHYLVKIDPTTGDSSKVYIPEGILSWEEARPNDGPGYLTTDGRYFYNLTLRDSLGNHKYVLRTIDPQNGWHIAKPDIILNGSVYDNGFSGFFVALEYIYPSEYFDSNAMRRIRLEDGYFEEEWISYQPFKSFFAWAYDWVHDEVYASVFRESGFPPKFSKFRGSYIDSDGTIYSEAVGPVLNWKSVSYEVDRQGSLGNYTVDLQALKKVDNNWATIYSDIPTPFLLNNIEMNEYSKLRLFITFSDSSYGTSEPLRLKNINFEYTEMPEVVLITENLSFNPDSLLQGLNLNMNLKVNNISHTLVDTVSLKFFLNNSDTSFYVPKVNIKGDSSSSVNYVIQTTSLMFNNSIQVVANTPVPEFFTYNNITMHPFYVSRDSLIPNFNITFDGREIINGDIISSEPEVVITLEDNSPLPLDSTYFTIVHTENNIPKVLNVPGPDITYNYTPYPNSHAVITWKPKLEDGRHILEVLAKDASGNFFDSTSSRSVFNVYNNPDLLQVYNYPNPFSDNTYFTFELRGVIPPEEFKIKIFTVAGRLIKEMNIPPTALQIGFNKILWDGRDQDGDEVANGLYFYKILSKHGDEVKTVTQKLAKVK